MPIYAIRKANESQDRLINRFKRQVQQSRLLAKVKSARFQGRKKTKRQVKTAAIMREFYRTQRRKKAFY